MLDIKLIKEETAKIREMLSGRGSNFDALIDKVLELDMERREAIYHTEQIKQQQNAANKEIPKLKKSGGDTAEIFSLLKDLSDKTKGYDAHLREIEAQLADTLHQIPNIPSKNVPLGVSDKDNKVMRHSGEPRSFEFEPKAHWDIGEELGILNPVRAAKVTGARFHFYIGAGAALERALINYYLDTHTRRNGYTEIFPPFLANRDSMTSTGQLPKFYEDMFHVENTDYFLIPTAEVPVTNYHKGEILNSEELPLKYAAYSACFRAEAGSAGRDTRGLIRQHQFNKVELVWFCRPEESYQALEMLTQHAESVLQGLDLPYRVVALCGGDLGFSSAFTYDIEVWMPSYGKYTEISSCSNFESFQARRAGIRYRDTSDRTSKPQYIHTLNGSGVAIGRTVACVLENYQNSDGTVTIPKVLRPYMGDATIISAGAL